MFKNGRIIYIRHSILQKKLKGILEDRPEINRCKTRVDFVNKLTNSITIKGE